MLSDTAKVFSSGGSTRLLSIKKQLTMLYFYKEQILNQVNPLSHLYPEDLALTSSFILLKKQK